MKVSPSGEDVNRLVSVVYSWNVFMISSMAFARVLIFFHLLALWSKVNGFLPLD